MTWWKNWDTGGRRDRCRPRALAPEDECVYALLSREPRHIDDLARDSTLPPQDLLDALLRLELDGLVDQVAGKRFLRRLR